MSEKYCNGCKLTKSLDCFQSRIKHGKTAIRSRCRDCENAAARKSQARFRKENPELHRARNEAYYERNPRARIEEVYRRRAKEWGYDPDDVLAWVRSHGPECDSCGEINGTLHLDHCHETNDIRGLLCGNCNTGIGQMKDDVDKLQKAIDYLKSQARPVGR